MQRARLNYLVDVGIGIAGLASAVSGLIFLLPADPAAGILSISYTAWNGLHTWSSLAAIAGVGAHMALHWKWMVAMTRQMFSPALLSTGDDGVHADAELEINGGEIRVTDSYEGIEGAQITINGGSIRVASSDDGINVASGNDASGFAPGPGRGGTRGQMPGSGVPQGGWPGQDTFSSGDNYLRIDVGYIAVDAYGDGLDINGTIDMTDGAVVISGPTENMNGALDYLGEFKISGGFLVAAGSAGMNMAPRRVLRSELCPAELQRHRPGRQPDPHRITGWGGDSDLCPSKGLPDAGPLFPRPGGRKHLCRVLWR